MQLTESTASDVEACDAIYESLETGHDPPDAKLLLVCAQIAAVFVKAVQKRMAIRLRIMVDDVASPMIHKVHPKYFRYAVAMLKRKSGKIWTGEIAKLLDNLETIDIVSFPAHKGKHVEAWVSSVEAMDLKCTCGKTYETPVNAQRCRYGHAVGKKLDADVLIDAWDRMNVEERANACLKVKEFGDGLKDFPETRLMKMIRNPGKYNGWAVLKALDDDCQGTHLVPYDVSPRPELMDYEDLRALMAVRVGKMLAAKATADALLLADFLDEHAPSSELDRACWQLQLRAFKNPETLNAYRARVEEIQKKHAKTHVPGASRGVERFVEKITCLRQRFR